MKRILLFTLTLLTAPAWASGGGWERLEGVTYTVPVAPGLESLARFDIEYKTRVAHGRREVEYTLPRELTGREIEIEAAGPATADAVLTGDFSYMRCTTAECLVSYPNLALDENEVRSFLAAQGVGEEELTGRMEVFARFRGGDPAGVIHLPPKPEGR